MDIRQTKLWGKEARERLQAAPQHRRIALIYAVVLLGMSAVVTIVQYLLDGQIAKTAGLSGVGTRTMLTTVQTLLPIGQTLVLMCLEVGFLAAMLRVARGQAVSHHSLRLGFDRFWLLIRVNLLQELLYVAICIPVAYLGIALYALSPLSAPLVQAVMPLLTQETTVLDEALMEQLMYSMVPCMVFCSVLMCLVLLVISYRYRMVNYLIIDQPGIGAMAALRESRKMMKGHCWQLFRLDVKLWWYYGLTLLATAVSALDILLELVNVSVPMDGVVFGYLCYGVYLVMLFGISYFLRPSVEVRYAFAYDAIRPRQQQSGGVVLGNIFQM